VIGRVFDDRYEVIRLLGTGGMAEVYLVHDRHLERDVALKVLSTRYAGDEQFIERFRREASSAAGLSHPNIVQIYDRGEAEGTYYIAMEYLEGRSLKDLIVRYAPLSAQHVVSLGTQILEALRYAHRRDIVHRDIKPQNIIVDDEGRLKVTDFGIARAGSASTMTEAGSILGTAQYLSPEQAQGGQVEAASDLYSLGVVMYEMATGVLPFTGDNAVTIAMKHVSEPPVPPRVIVPAIPENLERVILRSLAKQPEKRYITAQAFLEDLQRVQRGETVAPAPVFAPSDLGNGGRREDQATQVMGRVAVAPPQSGPRQLSAEPHAPTPLPGPGGPAKKSSRAWWPWVLVVFFVLILAGGVYALVNSMNQSGDSAPVPRLVGLTQAAAEAAAKTAGFTLEVAGEAASTLPAGQVTRQNPEEGDKLRIGDPIRVWLAAKKATVKVPNLVGMTPVGAVVALNGFDLKLGPTTEEPSSKAVGTIVSQTPAAGDEVPPATEISVVVSSGPASTQVKVPDLVKMDQEAALALLGSLKLKGSTQPRNSDRPAGEVVDQSPKAGTEVAEGSTVTIWASNASVTPKVTVDDVVGKTRAQAVVILTKSGFEVVRADRVDAVATPGTVVDQVPAAGVSVDKGSKVTIYVAVAPPPSTTTTTTTTTEPPPTTTTTPPPTG
jgi:serine/threonine-protein kinase